jgi:hypothetical protein
VSPLRPACRHPDRSLRLRQMASEGKPKLRIATEATRASIRRFRSLALSKSEVALPKREVFGVRSVGMPSTSDVPSLRYVRGQPSFDAGTNLVPAQLGRNPDEMENSEDCGSAGGHGNQHVRLRGASIDASKRSARLRQQLVAAGRASCTIPRKFSTACVKSMAWIPPKGTGTTCAAGRRSGPDSSPNPHSKRSHGSPLVPASC